MQEKNSLVISAEISLQSSLSSVILNVESWSSAACHARFFLSLKNNLLRRSYQYWSVLFLALLLLSKFWVQVCLANPSVVRHLLATYPLLSYSLFPYHLIYPLLFGILVVAVCCLRFFSCFSNVFVCHLNLMEIFLYKGMILSTAAEGFSLAVPPALVEYKEMSNVKEIWTAG